VLEQLLRCDSWFKRQVVEVSRKHSLIKVHLLTADERRALDSRGIATLGPLAKPLVPRLIELLKEKSPAAINGLAEIGPDAVLPLVQCLTNETPYVRSAAMISLSMIRPDNETALRAMVKRLDDRDNRVKATAANALRSFW